MAILILSWLIKKTAHGEYFSLSKGKITSFFLLLIFSQFISIFVADKTLQSAVLFCGYLLYYYFIFFILSDQIKTDGEWKKIVQILVFLSIALGIIAIIEFLLQQGLYDQFRIAWLRNPNLDLNFQLWRVKGVIASKGPFGGTQSFGFLFSMLFFIGMYGFLAEKKRTIKIIKLAGAVVIGLGLLTTQVRASVIAVAFTFILSLMLQRLTIKQVINTLLTLAIILISIIIIAQAVPAGFWQYTFSESVTKVDRQQSTFYKRIDGLKTTLDDIWERPITGYGTGAVIKHMANISKFELRSDLPLAIAFYIENGIMGFFAFLGLVYHVLAGLWRNYQKQKTEILPFYLLLGFIAYFISTLSAPQLESSFTFFVLLAYAAYLTREKTTNVSII